MSSEALELLSLSRLCCDLHTFIFSLSSGHALLTSRSLRERIEGRGGERDGGRKGGKKKMKGRERKLSWGHNLDNIIEVSA